MSDAHWDGWYDEREPDDLPWHEPTPATLPLVTAATVSSDAIIDVGGGASRLIDELLTLGYDDLTVLDLSAAALDRARERLGERSHAVHWVHADVTTCTPLRAWRLWHDRAVFHFLVDLEQRRAYAAAAAAAVEPGGHLVVATFGPAGPTHCAGLPVRRYTPAELAEEFAAAFELVSGAPLPPPTTRGDQRPYVAVVMRRREPVSGDDATSA